MRASSLLVVTALLGCSEPPAVAFDAAVPDAATLECPAGQVLSALANECIYPCPTALPEPSQACLSCPAGMSAYLDGCERGICGCHIPCPAPPVGHVSVCGWLRDFEGVEYWLSSPSCLRCDADSPEGDGPCGMRLEIFDRMELEQNGAAATPLVDDVTILNDCGRFVFADVPPPASGEVVVRLSNGASSTRWTTAVRVVDAVANARSDGLVVYALRAQVVAGWSLQASSLLGGQSLASVGAAVEVYRHKGAAVGGVDSGAELYFADEASGGPIVLDVGRDVTGTTGGALRLTEAGGLPSGGESELEGCSWPMPRSVIVPGHVSVTTVDSVAGAGGEVCE